MILYSRTRHGKFGGHDGVTVADVRAILHAWRSVDTAPGEAASPHDLHFLATSLYALLGFAPDDRGRLTPLAKRVEAGELSAGCPKVWRGVEHTRTPPREAQRVFELVVLLTLVEEHAAVSDAERAEVH